MFLAYKNITATRLPRNQLKSILGAQILMGPNLSGIEVSSNRSGVVNSLTVVDERRENEFRAGGVTE